MYHNVRITLHIISVCWSYRESVELRPQNMMVCNPKTADNVQNNINKMRMFYNAVAPPLGYLLNYYC